MSTEIRKSHRILPKLKSLVWALVAHLVSNGCSSHVHRFPITWSQRDRLKGMAGTCSFLYLVDYIVPYSYCKLTIIFSIPNPACQSSILFLVSIYILPNRNFRSASLNGGSKTLNVRSTSLNGHSTSLNAHFI